MLRKLLLFSAIAEVATGLALMIEPRIVIALLLGGSVGGDGLPLGRVAGIALLALGLACWPSRRSEGSGSPALRAMLVYNALIALYLAYLFMFGRIGGVLLWPAVALHAAVAILLVLAWGAERSIFAGGK